MRATSVMPHSGSPHRSRWALYEWLRGVGECCRSRLWDSPRRLSAANARRRGERATASADRARHGRRRWGWGMFSQVDLPESAPGFPWSGCPRCLPETMSLRAGQARQEPSECAAARDAATLKDRCLGPRKNCDLGSCTVYPAADPFFCGSFQVRLRPESVVMDLINCISRDPAALCAGGLSPGRAGDVAKDVGGVAKAALTPKMYIP